MDQILDQIIFGSWTLKHLIIAGAIVAASYWIIATIIKRFGKKDSKDFFLAVRCRDCGWTGRVSKFHATCRQCNSDNLEKPG